jgi:hypothetical protein
MLWMESVSHRVRAEIRAEQTLATVEMLVSSHEDEMFTDAERAELECLSDPRVLATDRAQRSYAGQYRRHVRRRRDRSRDGVQPESLSQ